MNNRIIKIVLFAFLFSAGVLLGLFAFFPWADVSERVMIEASTRISRMGGELTWGMSNIAESKCGTRYAFMMVKFGFVELQVDDLTIRVNPVASLLSRAVDVDCLYRSGSVVFQGLKGVMLEEGRVCLEAESNSLDITNLDIQGDIEMSGCISIATDGYTIHQADLAFSVPENLEPLVEGIASGIEGLTKENDEWRLNKE